VQSPKSLDPHKPGFEAPHRLAYTEAPALETLDEYQAADFLGVKVKTLRNWRVRGVGPAFLKYGGKLVRYRRADLLAWQESQRRTSTSERGTSHA
jgi:hypothetical protein